MEIIITSISHEIIDGESKCGDMQMLKTKTNISFIAGDIDGTINIPYVEGIDFENAKGIVINSLKKIVE